MTDELFIWIERWDEFQVYHRKRGKAWTPPWIRNYTRLLDDRNYLGLTLRQRGILHGLWLLAARTRLELGSSPARLGQMLGDPTVRRRDIEALSHAGFIRICSRTVLEQLRNGSIPEVEVDREEPVPVPVPELPLRDDPDADIPFDRNGAGAGAGLQRIDPAEALHAAGGGPS